MEPKVSVVIPTFNRRELVGEAIGSVLKQSVKELELIVVDDGSTDGTGHTVNNLSDGRVRYIYKENGGVASARNVGLDESCGEYVALLDSDDFWRPNYLERMLTSLDEAPQYGLAYTTMEQRYHDGRIVRDHRSEYCRSGWVTVALYQKFFVTCQGSVIRRVALGNLRFDEENYQTIDDMDFFLRLSTIARFLFVPGGGVIRRIQPDSLSQEGGRNKVDVECIRVLERFYYELGGKGLLADRMARRRLSRAYRRTGYQYCRIGARKAAMWCLVRARKYYGMNLRVYRDLLRAWLIPRQEDTMPDWCEPELPTTTGGKEI